MQRYFLVPQVELEPQVFLKITDNWVELTMRYVANPKRRRVASSFIYTQVFERIRGRADITVASATLVSLNAANAPHAMKPPVPSDSWPA